MTGKDINFIDEELLEAVVAAVTSAVETNEPGKLGHGKRVAQYCMMLADAANKENGGAFGVISFSKEEMIELKYSALLHDIGKINVKPQILQKSSRLYPGEVSDINIRFEYILRYHELLLSQQKLQLAYNESFIRRSELLKEIEQDFQLTVKNLKKMMQKIRELNNSGITPNNAENLHEIEFLRDHVFARDLNGKRIDLITDSQLESLRVKHGNLTESERLQIQEHVNHGYEILRKIPWPKALKNIPEIVRNHHERADGSRYPNSRTAEAIPLQSMIIAVADVFDALTASDVPYRKGLDSADAVSVLRQEAELNNLDADVVDLFCRSCVPAYEKIAEGAITPQ